MSVCVLDTDVVIAALDRRDAHHAAAARALTRMIEHETSLLLSTVNYAEALVRPAEDERTLRAATDAIAVLGVRLIAPTPPIARDAARHRSLAISLADGFAIATAQAHGASVATFDRCVRRALRNLGTALADELPR
ncbi:MAG TPA: PIN domain-containing protein [Conexibacter sp.]|nr:PIN domain-containing protein [Conexibacter sp.]